eukprot:g13609.t1
MVINSLNKWSEPGARLAKELHKACDLPIDVYMYLTPPYSQSYGFHSDVMDAFMVQLAGSKLWKLCDVPSWMSLSEDENDPKKLNASCEEIQMKGGDVMYVPYGTLHQASTSSDFSMHLTVNIERQYYVWLAVIFAMMHKAVEPKLSIEGFLNAFAPDDMDIPAVRSIYKLSPKIPMLHRLPGASQTFLVSLCNEDLPGGHLEKLKAELEDLIGNILNVLSSDSKVATSSFAMGFGSLLRNFAEEAGLWHTSQGTKRLRDSFQEPKAATSAKAGPAKLKGHKHHQHHDETNLAAKEAEELEETLLGKDELEGRPDHGEAGIED